MKNAGRAVEWGIALGLVAGMSLVLLSSGQDDFSQVFFRVGKGEVRADYWYPPWNTWACRGLALFPREVGLVFIWAFMAVVVLKVAPMWGTPAWLVLLSPPFLKALWLGQPFEAVAFCGLTLLALAKGRPFDKLRTRQWMSVLGLALLFFKPQIALFPALLVLWTAFRRREWLVLIVPLVLAVLSGNWWLGALRDTPSLVWNDSPSQRLGLLVPLWFILGGWLLSRARACPEQGRRGWPRQLWIAALTGYLVMPYWAVHSLWPLVAMLGCFEKECTKG